MDKLIGAHHNQDKAQWNGMYICIKHKLTKLIH